MVKTTAFVMAALFLGLVGRSTVAAELSGDELQRQFAVVVSPFLKSYCHACHGNEEPKGELNLSAYATLASVAQRHSTWELVLERLTAGEMPPEEAKRKPTTEERQAVVKWIKAFRANEAQRNAGDPGVVPARRLSNAEYNYTIRDLTGVDILPAKEFPVDPANEAGFDNSGESLSMSPALAKKYVDAARQVSDHLVLKPNGLAFAPHPVVTDTDRDKYCVKRIVDFYQRQPTDYADYFLAAWRFKHRAALGRPAEVLDEVAKVSGVSATYLAAVWSALAEKPVDVGPLARLQTMWRELPSPDGKQPEAARAGCEAMRDFVLRVRKKLEPKLNDLDVRGIHKGSQPFVLWKNREYAAYRRSFWRQALQVQTDPRQEGIDPDLAVPADEAARARYEESFARFCDIFPDAFYISERGRDYVGKPKEAQEKGRLLSAGFHSMMGYFRDDRPLYDLVLDEMQQSELDSLWQELDFVALAPMRQYTGFLWFERTDSRYMRDPQFDFARSEDKDVASQTKIERLAEVYLEKARANGGEGTPIQAIEDYFRTINAQIRWVEVARRAAEPSHLTALLEFTERAYRRPLTPAERDDLLLFYQSLRGDADTSHEEAVQDVLVAVLMSPHFCYRMELAESSADTRPLKDYALASRLSYFLWSSLPDAELLAHAAAGDLHEPMVLAAQARRMMNDDRIRALAIEFGGNWLDFRHFEEHNSVARERFPSFTIELRQAMFEEPIEFFVDLVQRDGSVLDFLVARHTFVNSELAQHYGMSDVRIAPGEWRRVENATTYERGGLLPMAVFLTQNSPGLRTSPVKRGYWVVRRLLGERIPPPPPTVPELPADESKLGELTLRETLAKHREHASCAACHQRFDSFGLVFEGFGPVGERRQLDLGGRPVDTQATFPDGSKGTGIDGLRAYLRNHRQEEFLDNLCRKLLSYGLGRTLLPSDDSLVGEMHRKLAEDDHRFGALVQSIVTSRQFMTKRGSGEIARTSTHE